VVEGVALRRAAMLQEFYSQPFILLAPAQFVPNSVQILTSLVAEILATATGINIAIAPLHPEEYATASKWLSFEIAWKETARVYMIVIILLTKAAMLEIMRYVQVISSLA
jgi:hypothetical protein